MKAGIRAFCGREKWDLCIKQGLLALQRRLLRITIKAYLCIKQGLFAMQRSLVCSAEVTFLRQNSTLIFAQKRFCLSNNVAISRLRLHAVFCEIPDGFPFLCERTDFGAVRNANIRQADGQCAMPE